jgi:hypothetical protein
MAERIDQMLVYHIIDIHSSMFYGNEYVQVDAEVKRDEYDRTERIRPVLTSKEYFKAIRNNTIVLD